MKRTLLRFMMPLMLVAVLGLVACGGDDDPVKGGEDNGKEEPQPQPEPTPEPQPDPDPVVTVSQSGDADFTSVQQAINSLPQDGRRRVIYVREGVYKEKITLSPGHNNVVLMGENAESTILTYDDNAGKVVDGAELGTQNSASFAVRSHDFMAVNITFQNSYVNYSGQSGTQAVALRVDADRAAFYNCRIVGYQDTFYIKNAARTYCKDCYIEGNVDFIFGDGVAYFDNCTLHCNRQESVLTAAATLEGSKFGFVFESCTITHIEGHDFNGTAFQYFHLGRPWKNKPKTVFLRCYEPEALSAAGWRSMSVEADLYAEYQCRGAGASAERLSQREMGGRQLSDQEALEYTIENIFSAATNPSMYSSDWMPEPKYELSE